MDSGHDTEAPSAPVQGDYTCLMCGQPVLREGSECYDCRKSRPEWLQAAKGSEDEAKRRPWLWGGICAVVVLAIALVAFPSGVDSPTVRWSSSAGAEVTDLIAGSTGGVVVAMSDGSIVAFAEKEGAEQWRHDTEVEGRMDLVSLGEVVYVCDAGGTLTAIDDLTGDLRWDFRSMGHCGRPAVAGSHLVLGLGDRIAALTNDTGRLAWSHQPDGAWTVGDVSVFEGVVFFGYVEEDLEVTGVAALDIETRELLWAAETDFAIEHAPVLAGAALCIAGGNEGAGQAVAIDRQTGEVLWTRRSSGKLPVFRHGVVLLIEQAASRGSLVALDVDTGTELWKTEIPESEVFDPVADAEMLYYGVHGGIYALRPLSGKVVWKKESEAALSSMLARGGRALFWATVGGNVHAARVY